MCDGLSTLASHLGLTRKIKVRRYIGGGSRDDFVFQPAEEEYRDTCDLGQRRLSRPYLVTQRCEEPSGRESTSEESAKAS